MERYRGIISVRLQNEGSKSEGRYALLLCEEPTAALRLCREGETPSEVAYFEPFDGLETLVCGQMSHDWLIVKTVEVTVNNQIQENSEE